MDTQTAQIGKGLMRYPITPAPDMTDHVLTAYFIKRAEEDMWVKAREAHPGREILHVTAQSITAVPDPFDGYTVIMIELTYAVAPDLTPSDTPR